MRFFPPLALLLIVAAPLSAEKRHSLFMDVQEDHAAEHSGDGEKDFEEIVKKMRTGKLPRIQFEFDSEKITADSFTTLDAMVHILYSSPRLRLMILAHTDLKGTEKYNLDLSQRRAKSVKSYLVKQGIPPPSIRYRGLGFSVPIADNATEEGRAQNRRVEFRVTTRDWDSVY